LRNSLRPLDRKGGFDPALLILFILLNGLVFFNACSHDPRIGYDADEHLRYLQALSEMRLVTPQDSGEFFSPPLPYLVPALLISLTSMNVFSAAKIAQLVNVVLSVGVTLYLLNTCQLVCRRCSLKFGALLFVAILPVYYKTFAFIRGEPFVAFFSMMAVYYATLMFTTRRFALDTATMLGVALGLCALSRQWGVLLIPAVLLFLTVQWLRLPECRVAIVKVLFLSSLLALFIAGRFYVSLRLKYGSITKFHRDPAVRFSFGNQPPEFYFGLSPGLLFSAPVRPSFPNQFLPKFYSELWGDYWGYFAVYGLDTRAAEFISGSSLSQILSKEGRPSWLETNYDAMSA
jgi:hypothetical protein